MLLKRLAQNRKLIQTITFCALSFVITFFSCQKTEYDNPHDSSVNTSLWAPQSFTTAQTSLKTAELKWVQPDQRIDSFCIESRRNNGAWKVLGYNDKSRTSFIDSTYIPDAKTPIDYRITAIAWKNRSFSQINTITPVFGKPDIPTAVKDAGVRIKVSWYDTYSNEDGYKLEKKVNGGSWMLCADTIRGNSTFYYDNNPELNALITYRLSVRAAGIYCDTTGSKPLSTIIAQPNWFFVASLSQTSCKIDWKQGEDWTTGYKVDRQFGNNPWQDSWMKLDNTKTTFTDVNLPTDQDIKYRVSTIVNNSYSVPKDLIYGLAISDTITISNPTYSTVNVKSKVLDEGGSAVTEWGIVYGTNPNPTTADKKIVASTGALIGYTATLTGLGNLVTYYARTYAINRRGESYGKQKAFQSNPAVLPQLDVTYISSIYQTSAYASSRILSDGGAAIQESGFVYSKTLAPTINDLKEVYQYSQTSGNGIYPIDHQLTNLDYGTTYYVRSYAVNLVGVSYGPAKTFATTFYALPVVDTTAILSIDATRIGLSGFLRNNGADYNTKRGFVWGNNANPTINNNIWTDNSQYAGQQGTFTWYITNLTTNQTVHIRAYAKNLAGTVYSPERVITTKNISAPNLAATTVSIGFTSALLSSKVIGDGGNPLIEGGFEYATTQDFSVNNTKVISPITAPEYKLDYQLSSLADGATYWVRSFARNAIGLTYGPVNQFTTKVILPARVDSAKLMRVHPTTAYVYSYVFSNGGSILSDNGFVYGENPGPTIADNLIMVEGGRLSGSFKGILTNLIANHTYYVRAYVRNLKGIAYSPDLVVRTMSFSAPILNSITINPYNSNSYSCWGAILSDGGKPIIESGFVYSTSSGATINDGKSVCTPVPGDYGVSSLRAEINGLTAGKTYYIRAFATNSLGTSYGPEKSALLQ